MEYKWLLVFDPANSHLPAPSPNAKPLPKDLAQLSRGAAEDTSSDIPKAGQPFCDPNSIHVWSEINMSRAIKNPAQAKVDFSKSKQLWFYLGRTSTEAKAQYTGNLAKPVNDPDANFLDSVRPPPPPFVTAPIQRRSYPASYPSGLNPHAASAVGLGKQYPQKAQQKSQTPKERPYHGKYAINDPLPYQYKPREGYYPDHYSPLTPRAPLQNLSQQPRLQYNNVPIYQAPPAPMGSVAPMASMTPATSRPPSQHQNKPPEFKKVSVCYFTTWVNPRLLTLYSLQQRAPRQNQHLRRL